MNFIADLHIHSRFSRATSKQLNPRHLAAWARCKGIDVLGTGDSPIRNGGPSCASRWFSTKPAASTV